MGAGDPRAAAVVAHGVASFSVERVGLNGIPTLEQVEERWASAKRI
jgi:hypothetical protein